MLFGNKEELLDILKNNPNILKSISNEFQNDPEFLKAAEVINSELESGDIRSDSFISNAGEMIDYTNSEYEGIIKLINDMKKIHFEIVNSISLINDVELKDNDFDKISRKANEDIDRLEKIKLQTDDLISKTISSIVIGTKLSLKARGFHAGSSSLDLIEDSQYVLVRSLSGDYYISVNRNNEDEISSIKSQIISMKPELSDAYFNMDNGEIISSEGYVILINGYINNKKNNKEEDKSDNLQTLVFNLEKNNSEDKSIDSKDEVKEDASKEIKVPEVLISSPEDFKAKEPIVSTNEVKEDTSKEIKVPEVLISSPEDLKKEEEPIVSIDGVKEGDTIVTSVTDVNQNINNSFNNQVDLNNNLVTPTVFESNPTVENEVAAYNNGISSSEGDVIETSNEQNYIDNQFVFGKKDNIYYLIISSDISLEDVQDIKIRIAELMPELAGSRFTIDYGNILNDAGFETILTGFVKNDAKINSDILSENRSR